MRIFTYTIILVTTQINEENIMKMILTKVSSKLIYLQQKSLSRFNLLLQKVKNHLHPSKIPDVIDYSTSSTAQDRFVRCFNFDLNNLNESQTRFLLESMFEPATGYTLNLNNPRSFNEKMQWLKCYYRDPLITQCADKVGVRDYIKQVVGEEYLVRVLGIYNRPEEIDFSKLPNKFVIKVNWGSGQNIICTDKSSLDIDQVRQQLTEWMKPEWNHYYYFLEWCYKDIQPKILIEEYIENTGDIPDYKFFCYNGEPYYMFVLQNRALGHHKMTVDFFDRGYNRLPFTRVYANAVTPPPKPTCWDQMLRLARKLASPFAFVRVDMYQIGDKVKVGELTFYPGNGTEAFSPRAWDFVLGQRLRLPKPNAFQEPLPAFARPDYPDARLVEALIRLENRYGGLITNVPHTKVSPLDPRTAEEISSGGMSGGDRMNRHGYALKYASYLKKYLRKPHIVLVEVGILCGTGLAIWCDLLKRATIIGLDIDPSHFYKNRAHLCDLGAFRKNSPHIYEFDQLSSQMDPTLKSILTRDGIDIVIDDGLHTDEAILRTMEQLKPFLKQDWVYFIENSTTAGALAERCFPGCNIDCEGELTVVSPASQDSFVC